ncbi:hypothetical protein FQN53_005219 [Emmonsiellopsis sp. PD_33]|nr:hypothetical protein FQN53_005219 [Emmonsiellopsis sp. PD_33]
MANEESPAQPTTPTPTPTPTPTTSPTTTMTRTPRDRTEEYEKFKKFAAYTFLIASPIFIAMPPRKLDAYTLSLGAAFIVSANHISSTQTGKSIAGHLYARTVGESRPGVFRELPTPQAEAVQAHLRAVRDAQIREGKVAGEEMEKLKRRQEMDGRGKNVLSQVWMGGEREGWKEKRLREEQEALDEGKGYGDLIKEHIWEVWNWGKKEDEGSDEERK